MKIYSCESATRHPYCSFETARLEGWSAKEKDMQMAADGFDMPGELRSSRRGSIRSGSSNGP